MIRVIIDRHFVQGMDEELRQAELEARKAATSMPGYISGETLRDTANPQHNVVISTWRSQEDWNAWMTSEERIRILSRIEPLLVEPEQITVMEPL